MRIILLSTDCEIDILMKILHDYPATRSSALLYVTSDLKSSISTLSPKNRMYEIRSYDRSGLGFRSREEKTREDAMKFALKQEEEYIKIRVYSITHEPDKNGELVILSCDLIYQSAEME